MYMNRKLNLLSFGEEAAEMEPEEGPKKSKKKSAYDFLPEDKKVPLPKKEEKEDKPKTDHTPESVASIQPEKRQPEQDMPEQPPKKKHKEEEKSSHHEKEQQPSKYVI